MSNSVMIQSQRKAWTLEEDQMLQDLRQTQGLDWIEVARRIKGRNPSQCAQRWKRIKGYKLRRQWSQEEDNKLKSLVKEYGYHWSKISKLLPHRSGKQIREHYLNQLHPDLNNEPWSQEEDEKIVEIYHTVGGKWSVIQKQLKGRSENSIKNRFYSYLRNKYLNIKNPYYIIPEKQEELQIKVHQKINSKQNEIIEKQTQECPPQFDQPQAHQVVMPTPYYPLQQISSVNCLPQYQMIFPFINLPQPYMFYPFIQNMLYQ